MSDYDRNSVRWGQSAAPTQAAIDQGLRAYMIGVYNNMMLGLATTGVVALITSYLTTVRDASGKITGLTPVGQAMFASNLKWLVILLPFAFVMLIQFQFRNWSSSALKMGFFGYAAMLGVSLSTLMIVYTGASIAQAFFITATCFGAVSIYGYTTKRDLTALGSFCIMGLWGAIIAGLIGFIFQSSMFQMVLSVIVVLVSAGLQAWDNQQVREFYYEGGSQETLAKKATMGSLWMYINFINMFISIMRLVGNRN